MCGFGAITLATRMTEGDTANGLFAAGCLIFLAMLFDGLDGAAARWTQNTSEFGAHLDSLCDAISFGVAPAVVMYELARPHGYQPTVLWIAAAVYMVCALLRLARFNAATDRDPGVFRGLPSPGAAALVASFPLMVHGPQVLTGDVGWTVVNAYVAQAIPMLTMGVGCLMVSRVRYPHLFHWFARGRKRTRLLVMRFLVAVAVVVAAPWSVVPVLTGWYAFLPPVAAALSRWRRLGTDAATGDDTAAVQVPHAPQ